jgi:DNA mismatch repair protein MutS
MARPRKTTAGDGGRASPPGADRVDAPIPGFERLAPTSEAVPAWRPDSAGPPDGAGRSDGRGSPTPPPPSPGEATPSMAQYLDIKTANPDSILWYRMGDFYELFFDDAVVASQALGIVLTKRGKHLGQDIPMCGVPIHRADDYLQKLIRLGYRVAVCEQLEDPAEARKRGHKAVVKRDVVRLVTPGTLTEDSLLDAKARNLLTALFVAPRPGADEGAGAIAPDATVAVASVEISTGDFEIGEVSGADLPGELIRLAPSEVLICDTLTAATDLAAWLTVVGAAATPQPAASFDSLSGEHLLKARLGVADLDGIGRFTRAQLSAIGALLKYVDLTQIGRAGVLRRPRMSGAGATLVIDAATRTSLELVRSASGERATSLLAAIDRTITAAGARELARRIASPLAGARAINARLDAVQFLADDDTAREALRDGLRGAPDIARAVARLAFGRGGPRDLASVRDGLSAATTCAAVLTTRGAPVGLPSELDGLTAALAAVPTALTAALTDCLVDDPPQLRRDGGFVREGARPELDDARRLRDESRHVIAGLETQYVTATGIKSLKIRHNNILGYFIEVSAQNAGPLQRAPHAATFRHRQTLANGMRFSTAELADTEGRIAAAADRALGIEQEVFADLSTAIAGNERTLLDVARALAEIDCLASLAEVAREQGYVRPIVDDGTALEIRGGRHPVVEQALDASRAGAFIENDCVLGRAPPSADLPVDGGARHGPGFDDRGEARIWLVTGPNMAGKSTFLRQNALIALLAQTGAFVPARHAHIGAIDRLFSRVGASDDLARGRSTFMVEMVETAAILNQATDRSLVILDEIGRGTATFDGLSIAWATVEYLHDVTRCRALFATHYHELTALAGRLPGIANVTMDVKDWQDEIVFLHKVKPGAADRSYGIQVAKLAGLPGSVIGRAREVLGLLEKADRKRGGGAAALDDLPLFAAARPSGLGTGGNDPAKPSAVEEALAAIVPDDLTPKAALEALYRLKALSSKDTAKLSGR